MLIYSSIVYSLLLFLFLFKARFFVKSSNINIDYLGKQNSDAVKALCSFGVVFHHIANEIPCGIYFYPFQMTGFLFVSVFFFYSGYGLMYSRNNNSEYMHSFLSKRMTKILVPYGISLFVYEIAYLLIGYKFTPLNILSQFWGTTPVVRNSWFLIVLIYLYLLFWLSFGIIKNKIIV